MDRDSCSLAVEKYRDCQICVVLVNELVLQNVLKGTDLNISL